MNVIPLPGAARRKVANPLGMDFVAASAGMPRHPAVWQDHGGRRPWEEARFDRSAEMLIATAVFSLLPDAAKDEVRRRIAVLADLDRTPHAATALHIVECMK